ncbi:MAG: hypothetical protein ACLQPD_27425 [Desulfomonilaceae bacterium]
MAVPRILVLEDEGTLAEEIRSTPSKLVHKPFALQFRQVYPALAHVG